MLKFTFRLEPVLKHRTTQEEEAVLVFARAQQEYICRQRDLLKTDARLQETLTPAPSGKLDLMTDLNMSLYREFLIDTRNRQQKEADEANATLEQCRRVTVQKRQDRLVLEKLKQRKYEAYQAEVNSLEQKELDEQGGQLAIRKGSSILKT